MKRKIHIAANWKMNTTLEEAKTLASGITKNPACTTILCPPFTHLTTVQTIINNTHLKLGAQNIHHESKGAFTGEISGPMLESTGCTYVIIGHSERRQFCHETNVIIRQKLQAAFTHTLIPILCVGESLNERESNQTLSVITTQLTEALQDLPYQPLLVAYEPIWAIGTGKVATPEQAQEVHAHIRKTLSLVFTPEIAQTIPLQYGGSVTPQNAEELLAQPDIDGALVGGASLNAESFNTLIKIGGQSC